MESVVQGWADRAIPLLRDQVVESRETSGWGKMENGRFGEAAASVVAGGWPLVTVWVVCWGLF
jgi:hypothetical protein